MAQNMYAKKRNILNFNWVMSTGSNVSAIKLLNSVKRIILIGLVKISVDFLISISSNSMTMLTLIFKSDSCVSHQKVYRTKKKSTATTPSDHTMSFEMTK